MEGWITINFFKVFDAYAQSITYVGQHYEVKGTTVTKYYFAGATRLAVRTNGTLSYLLGDHIGSSSVTTDANGVKTASALYKAFGETRYTLGNLGTDYKFTGQRLQTELGIYWFQSRWMDPSLGRFTSPDTIVPTGTQGTQAWDRYAFVNNNPVRYNDPTGHDLADGGFISLGFAISWGFGRDDFWMGSLDLVWNNEGQVALFASPLVDHGAVDATVPVVSNTEQCNAPCLIDTTPKFMTPGIGVSLLTGDIYGDAFSEDVNKYAGPFTVASENLGDKGISIAFEQFTSVDPQYGVPDFQTTGSGFGIGVGVGIIPIVGGGIYPVDSHRLLPIEAE
jgi:RHS repeat-associated protein